MYCFILVCKVCSGLGPRALASDLREGGDCGLQACAVDKLSGGEGAVNQSTVIHTRYTAVGWDTRRSQVHARLGQVELAAHPPRAGPAIHLRGQMRPQHLEQP